MNSLTEKQYLHSAFLKFFIPPLLSFGAVTLGELADCLFIGSQVGVDGLAVIGFGAPIYALYNLLSVGITTGTSIHYAAALSEGAAARGNELFRNTLVFTFVILLGSSLLGLLLLPQLLSVLGVPPDSTIYPLMKDYLAVMLCSNPLVFMQVPLYYFVHCDNNPRLAAAALVISGIVDIAANFLLVVVLQKGVLGSVYSTLCSALVAIIICLPHILSRQTILSFGRFRLRFDCIVQGMKTGFATNAQYAYNFAVLLLFNNLLMNIWGAGGVACLDVVTCMATIFYELLENLGLTVQPMAATFYEERNKTNIITTLRYTFGYGGAVCLLLTVALWLGAPLYCPLFGLTGDMLLSGAVWAIRIYLLSIPFRFIVAVMTYYYQAVGKEQISYILLFVSGAAGIILFGLGFAQSGYYAFWWCYPASQALAFVLLVCCCARKKSVLFLNFAEPVLAAFTNNDPRRFAVIIDQVQDFCRANGSAASLAYYVTLIVEEVSSTIFRKQSQEDVWIQLTLVSKSDGSFMLHLRDNSRASFNPFNIQTTDLSHEAADENVLGMYLVQAKVKDCFYRRYSGFNTLVIRI